MLRPYQQDAIEAIRSNLVSGTKRQLVQAATGTGKTVVFANLTEQLKDVVSGKTLILTHRSELADQTIEKLKHYNPSLRVDKEMAECHADPANADIIVASVSTLGRKGTKRIDAYDWSQFGTIIIDEAHHSVASSYTNILEDSGALEDESGILVLGFTATPQRGDGQALAKIYKKVVFSYPLRKAIEDGWLVEIRGYKASSSVSLDGIKTVAGEYEQKALDKTVNTPERNQLVVRSWLDYGGDRQTVIFAVDIKHAKDLAEMFRVNGVNTEAVWGVDPDRADKIERHKRGEIKILVNVAVLTEGYDDWRIGCIVLASPTKSPVKFTQMIGRGTRLEEGCGNLHNIIEEPEHPFKRDCVVIDVVDNSSRNTLVTLPTLMGMSSVLDLRGKGLVASVHELEAAQQQYPYIDFTKLQDITQLQALVTSINFFDYQFTPDVENNSELSWFVSSTGSYVLMLPNKEHLEVQQNLLDKWEISGIIKGRKYRGERDTIEEAFMAADDTIFKAIPEALKILRREAEWHKDLATEGQLQLIRKLYKKDIKHGMIIPPDLTKGAASRKISQRLAGKRALK